MSREVLSIEEKTFAVTTLGCKLNQYETESIRQRLVDYGWELRPFEEGASVMIVNTCTVTAKTDARCRNAVRRARKNAPGALVVVTGCYAEVDPGSLERMDEADLVTGNDGKKGLPDILESIWSGSGIPAAEDIRPVEDQGIDEFLDHSRAFIKVQEGCDCNCAYCIIPRARGASRSVPRDRVLEQVRRLESNGCEEIVLTGIHIGRYGLDLGEGTDLASLVKDIFSKTSKPRIRLSSIELSEVSDGLLSMLEPAGRLARHLHIPLQSGDDDILRSMRRPYTTDGFKKRILEIKSRDPLIAIGTDVIVGLPGETEESFRKTRDFLDGLPLDYFHVFSYSRRPGTDAASMSGQVDPQARKKRSRELIELGKLKRKAFMENMVGRSALLLMQGRASERSEYSIGLSGNYCEVYVKAGRETDGTLREALVKKFRGGRLYGELLEASERAGRRHA